ncbi:MAG: hypothetical protein IKY83_09190, partial [Proteobacteria bacterium]|nr:hypothetical protein [Pseudomonadota bacterium]
QDAYNEGYQKGIESKQDAYNEGYQKGIESKQDAYNEGYQKGEENGFQKGEESGFQKGEESGFLKGEEKSSSRIALKMYQNKYDIKEISEMTGLTPAKIEQIIQANPQA